MRHGCDTHRPKRTSEFAHASDTPTTKRHPAAPSGTERQIVSQGGLELTSPIWHPTAHVKGDGPCRPPIGDADRPLHELRGTHRRSEPGHELAVRSPVGSYSISSTEMPSSHAFEVGLQSAMAFLRRLKAFWREFRAPTRSSKGRHGGHSLARTLRDSTHVRGARGGMPRAGTEQHHKIVVDGHGRYTKSFKSKDG